MSVGCGFIRGVPPRFRPRACGLFGARFAALRLSPRALGRLGVRVRVVLLLCARPLVSGSRRLATRLWRGSPLRGVARTRA